MLWVLLPGRKEGDLHCQGPSRPARAFAFIELEGKNTLLSAVLPGRGQDGSQGPQLHVRAGDLKRLQSTTRLLQRLQSN